MVSPTVIHFIRHGQVQNPNSVFYGRSPGFPLSEVGLREAQAVAQRLAAKPLAAVFSSPLLRARQTAEIILARHQALDLRIAELLNEVHSPFDGRPVGELAARKWNMYTGIGPGYEQPAAVLARARRFIAQVRESYPGQQVAAVTHGDVLVMMILWVKRVPVTPESRQKFSALGLSGGYPRPASISTFAFHTAVREEVPDFLYIAPDLGIGT